MDSSGRLLLDAFPGVATSAERLAQMQGKLARQRFEMSALMEQNATLQAENMKLKKKMENMEVKLSPVRAKELRKAKWAALREQIEQSEAKANDSQLQSAKDLSNISTQLSDIRSELSALERQTLEEFKDFQSHLTMVREKCSYLLEPNGVMLEVLGDVAQTNGYVMIKADRFRLLCDTVRTGVAVARRELRELRDQLCP